MNKIVTVAKLKCHTFSEVNSVLESALDNLAAISQAEIAAVRAVKTPSPSLRINLEVICLLKNIKPGLKI